MCCKIKVYRSSVTLNVMINVPESYYIMTRISYTVYGIRYVYLPSKSKTNGSFLSFAVLRTRTDLPDGQTSLSQPEHPLTHLLSHGHSSLQSASPRRQELIQLVSVVSQFSTQVKASSAHLFRQISFSDRSLKR